MHVMKINWNDKYTTIAAYVLIVFMIVGLLFVVFFKNDTIDGIFSTILSVLRPVAIATLLAYFLNRPMRFFETKVFKFKSGKYRLSRGLSITVVYILLLAFIVGFFAILVPQVTSGYTDLSNKMPSYLESITEWLSSLSNDSSIFSSYTTKILDFINNLINNTYEVISEYIPNLSSIVSNVAVIIKDFGLGLIASIYFLATRDRIIAQLKKLFRAMFKEKLFNRLCEVWHLVDKSFGGFIIGKIFDSTIIGLISLAVLAATGVPYYPLVSMIIAITNVVPIFGPVVGGVIGAFIVFVANSDLLIWFIIYDVLIQQIDGNFIGPKILGESVGLSATWIFISLTIMGNLLGFWGMIFGVPIVAVLYTLVKQASENKLKQKNLPYETHDYLTNDTGRAIYAETVRWQIKREERREIIQHKFVNLKNKIKDKLKKKQEPPTENQE